jgi:outer membrane protein assembly factor BamB
VEGSFVESERGVIRIRRQSDGAVVEVPFGRLSRADQRWLQDEVAKKRKPRKKEVTPPESPAVSSADWPTFRGARRDGISPDRGLLQEWPQEGPPLLWKNSEIGSGYSGVAVAGGKVYVTGDAGGRLVVFAFDLDGNPQWKAEADAAWTGDHPGSRATPTIDGDSVYVVSGNGMVACLDAGTGRGQWGVRMQEFGGKVPNWGYSESALIYNDLVVVTPGGARCIVALNKNTGQPMWTTQGFQAGAQYSSNYLFNFGGLDIITNGTAEGIVGVDAKTGRTLWSNAFSAGNTANCPTPVFADGHVFWANGYGKGGICLKLSGSGRNATAAEAWQTREMVCHHGGYIVENGYIYGNNNNAWTCLELATGKKMWEERGVGKGSLCAADGRLYLFSENNGEVGLAQYSPEGMEMKGTFRVEGDGPSWAHPVVIGGRLYLRYANNLYCFNVRAQ